ncbi:CHAP domain-containing protein [Pseudoflavonifractor sp. 524-17]|uniref:CHAP domain-containing protein n=1 Tax=Pseudoflavonifractor sp. 524-17 TaxID=2304577 RepID=UPI00137A5065|nr:CHAP domain-containing protein [Pseudoflavonifractor sp. 524-17]NCE63748.1 CHAP domain-containing protein [Pseudoflavonifractor sp. 524-17]
MATGKEILALAASYIGVKEDPPSSNNVIFNTHYYGGPVNNPNLHWCVAFVWDIFRMAGASELFFGGNKTASCSTLWTYHKGHGQAVTDFRPGDIVFFDFSGKKKATQHVGIVEAVGGGFITTIDGNTGTTSEANGGAVMRRKRALKYVTGGYRPKYEAEKPPAEQEEPMMTQEQFNAMLDAALAQWASLPPDAWSGDARQWAEEHKIVSGDGAGNRRYKSFCTREEVVQMLFQMGR